MRGSAAFRTGAAPGGALAPRWSKDRLWRAARATPSLDLNFADSKSLADVVTGQNLVTFTRASNASYVDSTGTRQTAANDVPRFDHNPLTGESLGLLVEEQRSNLLLNSGTLSTQSVTVTAVAHTLSFTGTGTITLTGASTAGPLVGTGTGEANRVSLTFTPTAGSLTLTVSGTVTNAQLEIGAFRTSYIATTGAAATRAADVASITGTAFSSWYRQDQGTMFGDWSTASSGEQFPWMISDGTLDESLRVSTLVAAVSNNTRLVALDGNSLQAGLAVGVYTPGSRRKTMFAYQLNNFSGVADGGTVVTDTSGTLPTVDRLSIGSNWSATSGFLGGHIRRLCFWPQVIPGSTSQSITR